MPAMRQLPFTALLFAAATLAQTGGPNPYVGQAKVFYQGLEFEKCLARLEQATRWKGSSAKELTDLELYRGLCSFNLGDQQQAQGAFRAALAANPAAALPPYTSPKIEALFEQVKAELAPAAAASATSDAPVKPQLLPGPDGSAPPAVEGAPAEVTGGRSVALPLALGGVAVLAVGTGVLMGMQAKSFEAQAHAAHFDSDARALADTAQERATFANLGYALAAAAATGAVVTFVLGRDPEREGSAGGSR